MMNLKNEYDIVIIDSGINLKHPLMQSRVIDGFAVNMENGTIQIDEDYQDYYGHGTAIYSIISKEGENELGGFVALQSASSEFIWQLVEMFEVISKMKEHSLYVSDFRRFMETGEDKSDYPESGGILSGKWRAPGGVIQGGKNGLLPLAGRMCFSGPFSSDRFDIPVKI